MQVEAALPFAGIIAEPALAHRVVQLWAAATAQFHSIGTRTPNSKTITATVSKAVMLANHCLLTLLHSCGAEMCACTVQRLCDTLCCNQQQSLTTNTQADVIKSRMTAQQQEAVLLCGMLLHNSKSHNEARDDDNARARAPEGSTQTASQLLQQLFRLADEHDAGSDTSSAVAARQLICSLCSAVARMHPDCLDVLTGSYCDADGSDSSSSLEGDSLQQVEQCSQCLSPDTIKAALTALQPVEPLLQAAAHNWRHSNDGIFR